MTAKLIKMIMNRGRVSILMWQSICFEVMCYFIKCEYMAVEKCHEKEINKIKMQDKVA